MSQLNMRRTSRSLTLLLVCLLFLTSALPALAQDGRAGSDSGWRARYWNNVVLTGSPVFQREESEINYNWGDGSPDGSVNSDRFSVEWRRTVYLDAGEYRFTAASDDGVRVYVDNVRIINGWFDHELRSFSATRRLAAGQHLIRVYYYDNRGPAQVNFNFEKVSGDGGQQPSTGAWRGEYFNNRDLNGGPVFVRNEAQINFDWGRGSPGNGISSDNFSARWSRDLNLSGGNYRFNLSVDDGARLYVNNRLVIDQWREQAATTYSSEVNLPGGNVPVRLEYFEASDRASVQLSWERIDGSQPPTITQWRGEYFNNRNLDGAPALVRNDGEINFNWGNGSPANGINNNNFSARWTRNVDLGSGNYRFRITVDDGARLYVNNRLLIDQWREQGSTTFTGDITLGGGAVPIRLEYFESTGGASVRLTWERIDGSQPPSITRWRGEYFNNRNLTGEPVLVRNDDNIDFGWGSGSPAGGISNDNFSARWTRNLDLSSGKYRFRITVDDGARLYVNNSLIIDQWRDQSETTYEGTINLSGGSVPVRMEYYEAVGGATARLSWERIGDTDNGNNDNDDDDDDDDNADEDPRQIGRWQGEYYNNTTLSGPPALVREDERVYFNWVKNSPAPGVVTADPFSVRWTGQFRFDDGRHRVVTFSDDGVRVYIDNELLIDEFRRLPGTRFEESFDVDGGVHTIRIEYFDDGGEATMFFTLEVAD